MIKQEDFSNFQESKQMPGQMLKSAREMQGITIETVSKHLHLTLPTIASLEADSYANMPAPVYIRGYLKKYAQFLKLDSEEILKIFEQNVEIKSKVLEEIPSYIKKKPISSSHMGVRFLTYTIAVVLLILVGLWLHSYEKSENPLKKTASKHQPTKKESSAVDTKNVSEPAHKTEAHLTPSVPQKPLSVTVPELKIEPAPITSPMATKSLFEENNQNILDKAPEKKNESEKPIKEKKQLKASHTNSNSNGLDLYY